MSTESKKVLAVQNSAQEHEGRDLQALRGKRIVVCEDEALTLMQLRRVLTNAGLTIVGAAVNGKDGVEIALRERPDIVLLDVGMPVMDGFEAARSILREYRPCIMMLTGYPDPESRAAAAALGIDSYVVKPVTGETLLPAVRDALAHACRCTECETPHAA